MFKIGDRVVLVDARKGNRDGPDEGGRIVSWYSEYLNRPAIVQESIFPDTVFVRMFDGESFECYPWRLNHDGVEVNE